MLKSVAAVLALLALAQVASADVIYRYTGTPFTNISGNWAQVFGAIPTEITATIDVASPFPDYPFGGSVGGIVAGHLGGIISVSISDGVRTLAPDTAFLAGFGTNIVDWIIGAGIPALREGGSDIREITTSNIGNGGDIETGDSDLFVGFDANFNPVFYTANTSAAGTWTVVTPEINTGGMTLVSAALLLVGYWRRRPSSPIRRPSEQ
jgi:hypothetical protein